MALPFALGEIIERQLARSHAPAEDESAVAIITADVITRLGRKRNRPERLVPHARNVEMALALTIQILLAQIGVPALQHNCQQSELVFFAKSGHRGNEFVSENCCC